MPRRRTHHDPEPLSRPTAAESQSCHEQGQRLDAARAEFRARWQARIDRKRRQAERTRRGYDLLAPKFDATPSGRRT
jgi:hypothetical protein